MPTFRLPGAGERLPWIITLPILLLVILIGPRAVEVLNVTGPGCTAYVHLKDDGTWRPGHITGQNVDRDTWSVDRYGTRPELNGRECAVRVGTR